MNQYPNILVIGDVMLDCYLEGEVRRISPEAPVPIVTLQKEWYRAGGAGNVAVSLAALGCRVTLVGVIGNDWEGEHLLTRSLRESGVECLKLVVEDGVRTICKLRVLAGSNRQQMLRVDREWDRESVRVSSALVAEPILDSIKEYDAVVLSDYDKGTLVRSLIRNVINRCRCQSIPCVVDTKRINFEVFSNATIITPNLDETSRVVGHALDSDESVGVAASEFRDSLYLNHFLVTRGQDGMTLASSDGIIHFKSIAHEVADVTGAGDTVTSVLAWQLASGRDVKEACRLATVAAGIAVSHPGCYAVKASELGEP